MVVALWTPMDSLQTGTAKRIKALRHKCDYNNKKNKPTHSVLRELGLLSVTCVFQ